ncbi:hypothetical protein ACHAXN_003772 [Cyclotella atomus]
MFRRYGASDDNMDSDLKLDVARCDHYSYEESNVTDSTPLTSNYNKNNKTKRSAKLGNTTKCLILPLILLTAASLYYSYTLQNQLSSLTTDLSSLNKDVSDLQSTVITQSNTIISLNATLADHSQVISRFKDSVSNSDVLDKLKKLKEEWNESQSKVEEEMTNTKNEIRNVLDTTKKSIDESVEKAQNEIHAQVELVQSDLSRYIRTTQDQFSTENSFMVYQLAGTFTLLGCLISMWHMTNHLRSFKQPFVQRKILAILWMCPIYSVTSWLSLVIPTIEGYLAILKDMYEAYVIYQFLSFLIAVLGKGDRDAVVDMLAGHASHLSPPIRCFGWCRKELAYIRGEDATMDETRRLADDVLMQCQVFAMQFVFLRPLLTAILFTLKKIDYHGPMFLADDEQLNAGSAMIDYRSPQFYLVILENISVFLAFNGLIKFYHAVQDDLSWCRPFPKFLCIKGVVFMTFWQGVVISLLADTTDLLSSGDDQQEEIMAKQTQNFLICLEMLGFSIAHFYCFPTEEWDEGYRPAQDDSKFGDNMALGDFLHDLKLILRRVHNKRRKAKKDKMNGDDDVSTVLEEDEELGDRDASDNGIDTLIDDVDALLEKRDRRGRKLSELHSDTVSSREKKQIQKGDRVLGSLKKMDAPKELYDATALLLQSSLLDENTAMLLTRDIMELSANDEPPSTSGPLQDEAMDAAVATDAEANVIKNGGPLDEEETNIHTNTLEAYCTNEDSENPTETSALLSTSIENEDMLKPSIFTMHSFAATNEEEK